MKKFVLLVLTQNSSVVGKGYISVLDFDEAFSVCDEAILFPFS